MTHDSKQYNNDGTEANKTPVYPIADMTPPEPPKRRRLPWVKIALLLIIMGAVMTGLGWASGSRGGHIFIEDNRIRIEMFTDDRNENVGHFTSFSGHDLRDIQVSATSTNIVVRTTRDSTPRVISQNLLNPRIEETNGRLTITSGTAATSASFGVANMNLRRRGGTIMLMNWDLRFSPSATRPEIRIYVPEGTILEELTASATSGRITIDGISGDIASLRTTSGNINFTNAAFAETALVATSGSIVFDGDISESLNARTTSGSVRVRDTNTSNATDITLQVTSGTVRYESAARRSDFNYSASVTSGTIRIDGLRVGQRNIMGGGQNGNSTLQARSTSGNVHLNFEN